MIDSHFPVILFALDREGSAFRRTLPVQKRCRDAPCRAWHCESGGQPLLVMEVGVGAAKVQRALDWLASRRLSGMPRASVVIMAGFAGSLTPELHVGDIFLATEIIDLEGNCWPINWPGGVPSCTCIAGRLLTSSRLIGDPLEKSQLNEQHAAQAVDMESATVARFCRDRGLPFTCIRAISDDVATSLSPHLVSLLETGQVSMRRLLATLAVHPTVIGSLRKLARDTRLASLALAAALTEMLIRAKT